MSSLQWKVQNSLDEARMLMLGVQVMIGFHATGTLEPGFHELSDARRWALLAGMGMLLLCVVLLMTPGAHHRVALDGNDTPAQEPITTRMLCWAFAPIGATLGIDVFISTGAWLGDHAAALAGAGVLCGALAMWYVWPRAARRTEHGATMPTDQNHTEQKVRHVLTEARTVLPGVQAMLGFLMIAVLIDGYRELPWQLKAAHFGALLCNAAAMCVLMAPAAYHRIVERGEATERFHTVASRLLLVGMALLAGGLALGAAIVIGRVTGSVPLACLGGGVFFAVASIVWFVWTSVRRSRVASTSVPRHQAS